MIKDRAEYQYVSIPTEIKVDGGIMPLRSGGDMTLRGEDVAFLLESMEERWLLVGSEQKSYGIERTLDHKPLLEVRNALATFKDASTAGRPYAWGFVKPDAQFPIRRNDTATSWRTAYPESFSAIESPPPASAFSAGAPLVKANVSALFDCMKPCVRGATDVFLVPSVEHVKESEQSDIGTRGDPWVVTEPDGSTILSYKMLSSTNPESTIGATLWGAAGSIEFSVPTAKSVDVVFGVAVSQTYGEQSVYHHYWKGISATQSGEGRWSISGNDLYQFATDALAQSGITLASFSRERNEGQDVWVSIGNASAISVVRDRTKWW